MHKYPAYTVPAAFIGLLASITVTAAAAANNPDPNPPTIVHFGKWGVDLSTRDVSVRPGDDFQRYASGRWLDTHDIPPDQSQNGMGNETRLRNQERLRAIATEAPADSQLNAFYASYIDEARLEQLDAAPLKPDLDRVAAIQTKVDFLRDMAGTLGGFGATLFNLDIGPDAADPSMNTLIVTTAGMGLPDRDYYLLDTYKPQRDAYRAYIERTLAMIGHSHAAADADRIVAFETAIARLSWPQTDLRDFQKTDNPVTMAQLAGYAPQVDWMAYLTAAKVDTPKLVLADKTAVRALAALYHETSLQTLKSWQEFKIASEAADFLSTRFVDSKFAFTRTLDGVQQQRPRWRRGVEQVDARLGELLGKAYVERYFSPRSKAMMEQLVSNLKLAAAKRIRENRWMAPPTKEAALAKLARMEVMVGYPDTFRDYSGLAVTANDLYGNVKRSNAFEWDYRRSQLDRSVDHKRWLMSPATVDAYNGELENKIVFPAGILQAPYFDPNADPAVNYGAAGAVIGHEMMHGFDDQGRKIDASGAVRDWWTAADAKRFGALASDLDKQYSSYEAAPGVFINGELTMGENIADMSGLQVAYEAYRMSLHGAPAPVLDGLTGDQRFFLAFAQVWRGKQRPDAIKTQVETDEHSPRRFRVIGSVRNLDAWYAAFHVGPNSKYYLPPSKRVHIW